MIARPLPTPAPWRKLGVPSAIHAGQVIQLPDGTLIRCDETGHLDRVNQGGAPKPGAAWSPAPGRRQP